MYSVFEILNNVYFSEINNGFFIECGAWDGVSESTCINFEKIKNWNGINIEAQKEAYCKLIENRPNSMK